MGGALGLAVLEEEQVAQEIIDLQMHLFEAKLVHARNVGEDHLREACVRPSARRCEGARRAGGASRRVGGGLVARG